MTISANINEGYTLTEAIKYFEKVMSKLAPENQITWKGKSEEKIGRASCRERV